METKIKHRILGVVVVIGLIVILLPFFQSRRELSTETTIAKTPPFPDQAVQVTDIPQPATTQGEGVKQQPDDTINNDHSVNKTTTVPPIANPAMDNPAKPESDSEPDPTDLGEKTKISNVVAPVASPTKNEGMHASSATKIVKVPHTIKPTISKIVMGQKQVNIKHSYIHTPMDNNGLFKLQNAAWVIQVGSYKNKENALRIANTLRANGYRAFIQRISTALGENTRVFVGPENKQAAARELAQQLENNMHLRGIVISYKPLAI
jgi:DedD protein